MSSLINKKFEDFALKSAQNEGWNRYLKYSNLYDRCTLHISMLSITFCYFKR